VFYIDLTYSLHSFWDYCHRSAQNFTSSIAYRSSSTAEFGITGYYDPDTQEAQQILMCPFPLVVALCDHNPPTLQTDRQTSCPQHKREILYAYGVKTEFKVTHTRLQEMMTFNRLCVDFILSLASLPSYLLYFHHFNLFMYYDLTCIWNKINNQYSCFDAVGWVVRRASGLYKTDWWGVVMVVCVGWGGLVYGPADATATHCPLLQ